MEKSVCLKCENLRVGYKKPGVAHDISFSINQGDYLCIVGENGSGKSTLVKTILSIIKPLEGKISWGDGFGKKYLGYLPQQTDIQKEFPATVKEIVLSGCLNQTGLFPFYRKPQKELAEKNMKFLGIEGFAKKSFKELSGGQQQRVLLARSLCAVKNLLIMDEPVSGLDPKVTQELYSFVKELNKKGITIIQITHDMSCLKDATHVLVMKQNPEFFTRDDFFLSVKSAELKSEEKNV